MRYVSLHTHSTFSYGDGFGPVATHVKRVAALGMKALAFTEHGNNSSHAQLEKECIKHGLHPIFGCEIYTAPTDPESLVGSPIKTRKKFHQTVLAKNAEGYRNLNRIVSASWRDYFYQWPTTPAKLLRQNNDGLVVLSGCADSLLSCSLLGGKELGDKRLEYGVRDYARAKEVIERYQSTFGSDYYLEVQRFPGLDRTRVLNPAFASLARETGAKLVATSDVHYPFPGDNEMQRILHAAHRGGTVESVDATWEYDILLTYPTSDEEIIADLMGTGLSLEDATNAVYETEAIAQRCNVELPKNAPIRFEYPTEFANIEEYVWQKLREGWKFRAKSNKFLQERKADYVDRVKYEMGQISDKGFLHYFAVISDAVSWAKDQKIPVGPARGSAAASLVCYLLRITEIDPMQFPTMLFARFIDPNRLDLPDIDLDFADDLRHKVVAYLVQVYGSDRVGNIGNFTRYRGKNSVDDVARVYKIPKHEAETVKRLIVERSGGDARQSESLADTFLMFDQAQQILRRYPDLAKATRLEGNYRGLGIHAAGIVISNAPITDTCAVYTRRKSDGTIASVIAYDKKDAEYVGMLKADFLGLTTMGMIGIALDLIGMDLEDLYRVPITDEKTLQAFANNDLVGIFQFEGRATAIVNRDVQPSTFGHLADINALSRPGPLFSGMTAQYVNVKHGREERERLHPVVDALTEWTYGQIVYQEQVLSIVKDLAGFPIERVGDIRRIISQKLGNMAMANALEEFIDGCRATHNVGPELARKIWNYIATSSTYSFNQSHSVSYSMLAFWCMWLKVNYPKEFYAAVLSKTGNGKDSLWQRAKVIHDADRKGIKVLPPSLGRSQINWTTVNESLMGGFLQIHGIGDVTANKIVDWRSDAKAAALKSGKARAGKTWYDLQEISGIGPKTIDKILDVVYSDDPYQINRTKEILDAARAAVRSSALPSPTHHSTEMPQTGVHQVCWIGLARNLNFKDYVEATRTRTGRDEAEILAEMRDPDLRKSCVIQAYDEGEEDVYIRINRYRYPDFEEELQSISKDEDVIVVFGTKREDFGISIHVDELWILQMDHEEEEAEA